MFRASCSSSLLKGYDEPEPLRCSNPQICPKGADVRHLAMEAGLTSRRKVVEATGYDIEEVDRENASDAKRAVDLGLTYRAGPGETQGARATPTGIPDPNTPNEDGSGSSTTPQQNIEK